MSHFTVLVIGPNYEEQLAPYHEFECTGCDDEYVQDPAHSSGLPHLGATLVARTDI